MILLFTYYCGISDQIGLQTLSAEYGPLLFNKNILVQADYLVQLCKFWVR